MTQPTVELEQPFLPRYQVESFVGEGGAARIYRVVDQHDGAVRAIKALKPESNAEPSIVERFENEFLILRRLHHPSLPEIYDYGFTDDGIRYIVMEFVEGEQLDVYYKEHREDLWLLLYELCEVLTFIHDRDLLHLDLKPANILVKRTSAYGDEKPMVVLMDFGLSYRRDVGGERSLVGTPEYMAPEIIRGDGRLTRAVDYYSLGIILYELLTGETPFRGGMNQIFAGHLKQEARFRQEKTENAELYPHVLGLVAKDIDPRLESFGSFRTAVSGRFGGDISELEGAYGLSTIRSLGLIGKESAMHGIAVWSKQLDEYIVVSDEASSELATDDAEINPNRSGDSGELGSWTITRTLLSDVQDRPSLEIKSRIKSPPIVYVLTGPPDHGKSYLAGRLVDLKRLGNWAVWRLGSESSGETVGTEMSIFPQHGSVDDRFAFLNPQSSVVDRYNAAWDRLNDDKRPAGTILIVDDFGSLNDAQIELLTYVSKRLEISRGDSISAAIYIFITDSRPATDAKIATIFGKDQTLSYALDSMTTHDIQNIIADLRGSPVTTSDKLNLERFLERFEDEPGTIPAALADCIQKGVLRYSSRRWRFDSDTKETRPSHSSSFSEFYKGIPAQLPRNAKEVLEWITCHNGPVAPQMVAKVSGHDLSTVEQSIELIKPFRILTVNTNNGNRTVRISPKRVQKLFYETIADSRRNERHGNYIHEYGASLSSRLSDNAADYAYVGRELIYHYSAIGEYRLMMLAMVRIAKTLLSGRQYYDLRVFCSESLRDLDGLIGQVEPSVLRSIRRYVLKQLVNANWAMDEFDAVARMASSNTSTRGGLLPLGAALKCGLAFVFSNQNQFASFISTSIKTRYRSESSQAYNTASLLDAAVLIQSGHFNKALTILYQVETHKHVMTEYGICRMYSSLLMAFERLYDIKGTIHYVPFLEDVATRNGFHNEYQLCLLVQFNIAFDKSQLSECMSIARRAIRVASRGRSYRRILDWYFRASAVYYETGSYDRAIKYVNKALPIAERLGLAEEVPTLTIRLAMNFMNAGAFGNSIVHMERAFNMWNDKFSAAAGAVLYLFSFEIHLISNTKHVDTFFRKATRYMNMHSEVTRWGFYWHLVGLYRFKRGDLTRALEAFSKSRKIHLKEGVMDDAVRTGLKLATVMLDSGRYNEAHQLLIELSREMKKLESPNIRAEYWAVTLACHYIKRSNRDVLERHLRECVQALEMANEVPVLLYSEQIMFRAMARLGNTDGASRVMKSRLRRIKKIVSNMPNREYAVDFLDNPRERLLLEEFRLLNNKKKGTT